jgi:hypothetical protein
MRPSDFPFEFGPNADGLDELKVFKKGKPCSVFINEAGYGRLAAYLDGLKDQLVTLDADLNPIG